MTESQPHESVRIVCAGPPVAKGRPRTTVKNGFVRVFTPASTRSYEQYLKGDAVAAMNGRPPFDCPLMLNILALLPIPRSWSQKRQREALYVTTRPDIDNYVKSALDALNGIVFRDDSLVVDLFVLQRYDAKPRLEITVEPMPLRAKVAA